MRRPRFFNTNGPYDSDMSIQPLPAFAVLFSSIDEASRRFIAPLDEARQSDEAWHTTTYRQHEDGAWGLDATLMARDGKCCCAGAIDLFADGTASGSEDGRQRLITAYRHYNEDFLTHFDGEFAFALADVEHETVILARDRLGAQALYYATDGKTLAVAGSLAGLSHLLRHQPAINAEYMLDFLAKNVPVPDQCIYQGVHILPPGHMLVFRDGAARVHSYWSLTPDRAITIPQDPAADVRELIIAAIKKRLPGKGKIVVQLSGGLDSSALLGFLTALVEPERLVAVTRAFAPSYRDERRDELAYAEDAARYCRLPLVVVDEEVTNPLPALDSYFERMGNFSPNPYYDISTPVNHRLAAVGEGVVFAGFGGDEGISPPGDIALSQLFLGGRWLALWRMLGKLAKIYGYSRWKLFRHWLLPKLPPSWLADVIEVARMPEEFRLKRLVLMRGDVRRLASVDSKKYQLRHEWTMAREIRAGVLGPLFVQTNEIVQFFSWRHDLRFVHPFLDKDLLAYAVSLPPESFLLDGWRRGLFRRAIAGTVPQSIVERRTKSPFSLPFPVYIRAAETMIMDMCHTANHPAWEYLDRRALAFFTRRICREEISYPIELAAVAVGNTAAMAMFLTNRARYWRGKS